MTSIEIFENVTCCSGGFDKELLSISNAINNLKEHGIEIKRYNLTKDPQAFIDNKVINDFIAVHGVKELPVTIVNNKIVKLSQYPTSKDFSQWLEIQISKSLNESSSGDCSCNCK